jgi:hypothetical protein
MCNAGKLQRYIHNSTSNRSPLITHQCAAFKTKGVFDSGANPLWFENTPIIKIGRFEGSNQ